MLVTKGTVFTVYDSRTGTYTGIATSDFDTEKDEWYSVAVHQDEPVYGLSNLWEKGEDIPCRRGLSRIKID